MSYLDDLRAAAVAAEWTPAWTDYRPLWAQQAWDDYERAAYRVVGAYHPTHQVDIVDPAGDIETGDRGRYPRAHLTEGIDMDADQRAVLAGLPYRTWSGDTYVTGAPDQLDALSAVFDWRWGREARLWRRARQVPARLREIARMDTAEHVMTAEESAAALDAAERAHVHAWATDGDYRRRVERARSRAEREQRAVDLVQSTALLDSMRHVVMAHADDGSPRVVLTLLGRVPCGAQGARSLKERLTAALARVGKQAREVPVDERAELKEWEIRECQPFALAVELTARS